MTRDRAVRESISPKPPSSLSGQARTPVRFPLSRASHVGAALLPCRVHPPLRHAVKPIPRHVGARDEPPGQPPDQLERVRVKVPVALGEAGVEGEHLRPEQGLGCALDHRDFDRLEQLDSAPLRRLPV